MQNFQHAIRISTLPIRKPRVVPPELPGRLRFRGYRSDSGLVLHVTHSLNASLRNRAVEEFDCHRPGARSRWQEDEQESPKLP